jgi:predicted dehydrogenase
LETPAEQSDQSRENLKGESMVNSSLQMGVVGCGFFAQNHLAAWASMKDVVLAAVCDLDETKARSAAQTFGAAAAYKSAEEMLSREKLDFVDIVTTMESHATLVELAAKRQLPLIVQKPLAPSWETCVSTKIPAS